MSELIDRQAAIDALGECQTYLFDTRDKDKKISREDAEYAIESLPSAEPKRIRGKWAQDKSTGYLVCDQCRDVYINPEWLADGKWNFCPDCGADMRGKQDGND